MMSGPSMLVTSLLVLSTVACSSEPAAVTDTPETSGTTASTETTTATTVETTAPAPTSSEASTTVPTTSPSTVAVSPPALPAAFSGQWAGTITSSNPDVTPFTLVVEFLADHATIDIGNGGCIGTLTPTSATETTLVMSGTWSIGACVENGEWTLTAQSESSIFYSWADAARTRTDSGPLTRASSP